LPFITVILHIIVVLIIRVIEENKQKGWKRSLSYRYVYPMLVVLITWPTVL
jgi:hypothetical protein